ITFNDGFLNEVPEIYREDISTASRKQIQQQMINRFPGKKVSVGETWKRNEEIHLGSGQKFYTEREFTYQGEKEHLGRILHKVEMTTNTIQFDITGTSIPLQVKQSSLRIKSSQGEYWYDAN